MRPGRLRSAARRLARAVLRIFHRRIEVLGRDPAVAGPAIFVLNHPNGLVDPLFILAFGPPAVSFLAKEPLFRMPVVGRVVKALDCLPVYRRQDGADPKNNAASMEAARDLLARGGSLALFPEGITHARPELQPLKTGASRIALSARALMHAQDSSAAAVRLIPVGLYYPARSTFRSDAAVVFGDALEVPVEPLGDAAQPPPDAVHALTARIAAALRALTVNARDPEHVTLAATAARLLEETPEAIPLPDAGGPVHRRLRLMQLILEHHDRLGEAAPQTREALLRRLRGYRSMAAARGAGGEVRDDLPLGEAARHLARTLLGMLALAPLIVTGLLENLLPYRLVGRLAARRHDEEVSTVKVLAGMLLFPLTWLAVSALVGLALGWIWAAAHLLLAPPCGWAALWFLDRTEATGEGARILWRRWRRPHEHASLVAERDALVAQLRDAAARSADAGR